MKKLRLFFCLFLLVFACGCGKAAAIGEDAEKLLEIKDKDVIETDGNYVHYWDNGEEFYGLMKEDEFIELVPEKIETVSRELTFRGITGPFGITYATYEGENRIEDKENLPFMVGDDEYDYFVNGMNGDILEMELVRNAQQDEWSYPFYYNLKTGEITDYLKDVTIHGTPLAELPQLSIGQSLPEKELLYVSVNKEIFEIDLKTGKSISLNELTGESNIVSYQVLEDGYFLLVSSEEAQERKGVYYRTDSGEKEVLFEGVKPTYTYVEGVVYTGMSLIGNDAVLIKEKEELYCIDHRTGEKWKVGAWEGTKCGTGRRIGERLIVEGDHNCGILDLEKKTYREIEIGKDETYRMCQLCDENSFTVRLKKSGSYSLTKYKLK